MKSVRRPGGQDGTSKTSHGWAWQIIKYVKRIDTVGGATLQDYWRRDPSDWSRVRDDAELLTIGELVRLEDGTLWHIVHMPPRTAAGIDTWKSDVRHEQWRVLEEVVWERVSRKAQSDDGTSLISCQLRGAVIRGVRNPFTGSELAIHVDARSCAFLGDVSCVEWRFSPAMSPMCGTQVCIVLWFSPLSKRSASSPEQQSSGTKCGYLFLEAITTGDTSRRGT